MLPNPDKLQPDHPLDSAGERFAAHLREQPVAPVYPGALRFADKPLGIVFRVISHHTDQGGTYPVCELLDWVGQNLPSREEWLSTPIRQGKSPLERNHPIKQIILEQEVGFAIAETRHQDGALAAAAPPQSALANL